ncbi:hypothetical protein [Actinomadura flavalba]|uniref:hypothetical protein n=1 Tax=Actinomadura flavalba TaxID=1120938 RepID=UPI00039D143A|nr:hypothetical protein [Actinomadura flavalba]
MNRRRHALTSTSAVVIACLLPVALAGPAHAAALQVSQRTNVAPSGQSITITGSGFDAKRNNGFGVYVVFGPRPANYFRDANLFLSAVWVHQGGGGNGQARMNADGSFSVRLNVKAKYTDGNGKAVDCLKSACYVMTMAAHGVPDRSQDTMVPIAFRGAAARPGSGSGGGAPGSGAAPGTSGTSGARDLGSTTPAGTAAPVPQAAPGAAPAVPQGFATPVAAQSFRQTAAGEPARTPLPFWLALGAVALAGYGVRRLRLRRHRV